MINTANNQLMFCKSGIDLHQDVKEAMGDVAKALLKQLKLESLDLSKVSTKRYLAASYPKFVLRHTLLQEAKFDESYVECVWKLYQTKSIDVTAEQFYAVMLSETGTEFAYKKTYVSAMKRGFGLFLIALHCRRAITLPMNFDWPPSLAKTGLWSQSFGIFSELLGFIHQLDANSEKFPHPAFMSVGTTQKRREWFLCYGTKLLLATGWLTPQEARIEDLLAIKAAESKLGIAGEVLAFKALIDVLRERYGKKFDITIDNWSVEMQRLTTSDILLIASEDEQPKSRRGRKRVHVNLEVADTDLLGEILKAQPAMASAKALRARPRLPGLSVDLATISSTWLDLQDAYKRTDKRESYKQVDIAFGYLNIYLFFYLAYWFQRRPKTKFEFPDQPRKFISSLFVSRLLKQAADEVPLTLVEYLNEVQLVRSWQNEYTYATLKILQSFFEFLELHGDELPGCTGFRQPIPDYAYPPVSRSNGTNKRPIPRRVFGLFLDYVEALRAHLYVILARTLSGELNSDKLSRKISKTRTVINTFDTSSLTGFIPVIFTRNKTIPLQYIPNCLALDWFPLANGLRLKLPQPHALNQILVALYTGLRHNHIQWLDARTFDSEVPDEICEFTNLFVNTDKSMRKPFRPHVNFHVIDALRDQLAWRSLIKSPGFEDLHYYNDNSKTKWPPILPLFSSFLNGLPHSDSRYSDAWSDIVCAVNALLPILEENDLQQLSSLEPPGVSMNDPLARSKRQEYGASCDDVCDLRVKTSISPHSCRVSVVSQYATFLPADVIGTHFTGQKSSTVYHYVVIEPEDLQTEKIHQSMRIREQAYRNAQETWGMAAPGSKQYIRADDVNSNLARSLRKNLQETLLSYGCISITMNEDATSGLDILRETRGANAAENKTEICPYSNQCPPEIIKEWRGPHRCGLCQYAVRSVDHLPAVSAKIKEFSEILHDLTLKVEAALKSTPPSYTDDELDRLDEERSRLAEELTGWRLNEEVLDAARIRIAKGQDDRRWIVQKPEIILQDLQRVPVPSNLTAYVITRLGECIAYPTSESPQIRARFDVLRRNLLAQTGQYQKVFDLTVPADPASECAGLLRSVVEANKLSYDDLIKLLEGDGHLAGLPLTHNRLLLDGNAP